MPLVSWPVPAQPKDSSVITIPPHVTLACETENPGPGSNQGERYSSQAAILLPASKTLRFEAGSDVYGCLIMRSNLVARRGQLRLRGTALSVVGGAVHVRHTLIPGFDQCLVAQRVERLVIAGLSGDCQSGLSLSDNAHLRGLHFWPYATVGYNCRQAFGASLIRSGPSHLRPERRHVRRGRDSAWLSNQRLEGAGRQHRLWFDWVDDPAARKATAGICMNLVGSYDKRAVPLAECCLGLIRNDCSLSEGLKLPVNLLRLN